MSKKTKTFNKDGDKKNHSQTNKKTVGAKSALYVGDFCCWEVIAHLLLCSYVPDLYSKSLSISGGPHLQPDDPNIIIAKMKTAPAARKRTCVYDKTILHAITTTKTAYRDSPTRRRGCWFARKWEAASRVTWWSYSAAATHCCSAPISVTGSRPISDQIATDQFL